MPKKRRNNGRAKTNRGHTNAVSCTNCGHLVPKDKAVKRYTVRNMVDASSLRDIRDNRAYESFSIPKFYIKLVYCISCAIHSRVVKVRSVQDRKNREPPRRPQRKEEDKKRPTVQVEAAAK